MAFTMTKDTRSRSYLVMFVVVAGITVMATGLAAAAGAFSNRGARNLGAKVAVIARMNATYEAAARAKQARRVDPLAARPKSQRDAPLPTGIGRGPAPFPSEFYLMDDYLWQGVAKGRIVDVYAGVITRHRTQGILIVVTRAILDPSAPPDLHQDLSRTSVRERLYRLPGKAGAARIVKARGNVLTIGTHGGRRFRFDVSAMRLTS